MAQNETDRSRHDRIKQMEADGVLTPGQAQLLLTGLSVGVTSAEHSPTTGKRDRRQPPWTIFVVLACIVGFVVWLVSSGGGNGTIQDISQTINQTGGTGEMNNSLLNIFAALLILAVPVGLCAWIYNSIVSKEEAAYSSWAQVESSYQRRSDLIPNLVDSVSRYMRFEAETLNQVTATRNAGVGELNSLVEELVDAQKTSSDLLNQGDNLMDDAVALAALQRAQLQVGGGMSRILALVENYPDLRSSDQFLELQGQLEGTENRINVARVRFNEAVESYNQSIRRLPGSLIAGLGSFQRKAYFEADAGLENVPNLDFN